VAYHCAAGGGRSHGHGNMRKRFGEDRTCSSEDMIADRRTQTHRKTGRQTDRQTDTLIRILSPPIGERSIYILRPTCDCLTIMPKLRSTCDGCVISKHHTKNARVFLVTICMQNRMIVRDGVRKLAYDIPERNLSAL